MRFVAVDTVVDVLEFVDGCNVSARVTDVYFEEVGAIQHRFFQKHARAVTYDRISLHFTHSQTTIARPAFRRLSCQHNIRTCRTRVNFVRTHVLQSLIVRRSNEDVHINLFSRATIVENFITVRFKSAFGDKCTDFFDRHICEWGGISVAS